MAGKSYPRFNAARIIKMLGGAVALQERLWSLGYPMHISTIHAWGQRGQISAAMIPVLLDIAERDGVKLGPKDFLPGRKHPVGDLLD